MGLVIVHGLIPAIAAIMADALTTTILYTLYKDSPPGSVVRITGVTPLPAHVNAYGYKLDTFKLNKGTTFELMTGVTRLCSAVIKYITDKADVSARGKGKEG